MAVASAHTRAVVARVKRLLTVSYTVVDPADYGLQDGDRQTNGEIVWRNKRDVASADAVVAVMLEPSMGQGAELMVAKIVGRTVIGIKKAGVPVRAWQQELTSSIFLDDDLNSVLFYLNERFGGHDL